MSQRESERTVVPMPKQMTRADLGFAVARSQRQVRHDFRDWREVRHADAVDEEVLSPARAGGQDGGDVVPAQLADLVEGAVLVACRITRGHGEQDDGHEARGRGEGRRRPYSRRCRTK